MSDPKTSISHRHRGRSAAMVQCDDEATCTTLAPFTDKAGETHFQFVQTCLHHAISIACWKLTIAIGEQLRMAEQNRRIQLI
jgi:hypothetical protein